MTSDTWLASVQVAYPEIEWELVDYRGLCLQATGKNLKGKWVRLYREIDGDPLLAAKMVRQLERLKPLGNGRCSVIRITKGCPKCGAWLEIRVNRNTGEQFLGCLQYPKCRFTEPLAVDLKLRMQGAPTLPGFDLEATS